MRSGFRFVFLAATAALSHAAAAAIVTPAALNGWSGTASGASTTAITTTFPNAGNGSAEITLNDGTGEVDWSYTLPTPVALSTFTSGSYDWWRDSASTNPAIQAPAYALWIDNDCNAATTGDQAYLVYEPYYQTTANAPTNQWVTETVAPASVVWQAGGGVPWSTQPISAYMAGTATGGTAINGSSCIIGVLAFAGSGWIGMFHGAVDNVTLSAGGTELVNANFETAAPADAGTVAVPTLGEWGLALTAMLLGGLGIWRRRPGARG